MNNTDILSYIDANIYNDPTVRIRGNVVKEALYNMATMDARVSGKFTDGPNSPDDGVDSIDFANRVLYDETGVISHHYRNRELRDMFGTVAITYSQSGSGTRCLHDASGNSSIQWDNRAMYGSDHTPSIQYAQRVLYKTGGSVATVDWENQYLKEGTAGYRRVDWAAMTLKRGSTIAGSTTLDWNNCRLYDTSGIDSIGWQGRTLINSSGTATVYWNANQLANNSGTVMYDWQLNRIKDNTGSNSIYPNSRVLSSASGNTSVDWNNMVLQVHTTGLLSVEWGSRRLKNSVFTSLDWSLGTLNQPSTGTEVLNWATTNQLIVKSGVRLRSEDNTAAAGVSPTVQTPSVTNGYGNATVGVLGQPSAWLPILNAAGVTRYIPMYS